MVKSFFVKNNSARPYTLAGLILVPGQVTEVPDANTNKVDIRDIDDLEIISRQVAELTVKTVETSDILSTDTANKQAATTNAWKTPS